MPEKRFAALLVGCQTHHQVELHQFHRFMQQGDLYLLHAPGQAPWKNRSRGRVSIPYTVYAVISSERHWGMASPEPPALLQAYLKYCEAQSQHERICDCKSGMDFCLAFRGTGGGKRVSCLFEIKLNAAKCSQMKRNHAKTSFCHARRCLLGYGPQPLAVRF